MRKKFLAISILLLSGIHFPAQASNEVTVESGTAENNVVINAEKQFDYVKYSKVIPLGYNLNRSFYAMAAGNNAFLTNNGTINFFYDEQDSAATYGLFSHPMYVYENSTMINNGTIYIDVEKSFMSRALATTGNYGSLINNGTIFNRTNSVAYGMSAPSLGTFTNNGVINARIQSNDNADAGLSQPA